MSARLRSPRTVAGVVLAIVLLLAPMSPGGVADLARAQSVTLTCPAPGFTGAFVVPAAGVLPFVPLTSLKSVANPIFGTPDPKTGARTLRGDLSTYVADLNSAIQLGKALFWDTQAGSDNKVACATCHFQAGVDGRSRNQLNPGANGAWDGAGVNYTLTAADFPFTNLATQTDKDNIAGSQGVRSSTFVGITSTGGEQTTPVSDPIFDGVRRVTGLNAPSTVNALFNHRNFYNGRAQAEFNGVNPWGARDTSARVWYVDSAGNPAQIDIHIQNASLASQAVGPPLNPVEMSAAGRTFPDLGKKLLLLKPLGLQTVDRNDSVLGALADTKGKGLAPAKATYRSLIQKAFQPTWWNTSTPLTLNGKTYSVMEANFALFWGLAIMLYEGTLAADNSPMDQYVATRVFDTTSGALTSDDPTLLDQVVNRLAAEGTTIPLAGGGTRAVTRADILLGLDLFEKPVPRPGTVGLPAGAGIGCSACHVSAETTSASLRNLTAGGLEPGDVVFKNNGFDLRMERMFLGVRSQMPPPPLPPPPVPPGTDVIGFDPSTYGVTVLGIGGVPVTPQTVPVATYDVGWYDIGVRPAAENLGVGDVDAFGRPLSWTRWFQTTFTDPSVIRVPGGGLGCVDAAGNPVTPPAAPIGSPFAGEVLDPLTGYPLLSDGLTKTEASDVDGNFKVPGLRNVELTGPYFHNGGKATLRQVVELYDDGGNFANATLAPLIRPLGLTDGQFAALVAFLVSLTDDRVRYQRAPFDHPELVIPAGQDASGADLTTTLPAVGAAGSGTPLPRFLNLNPFQP